MSVAVVVQALGWVCVVWLMTVHLMIQHGRLPRGGTAYRVAGCAAAISVVLASAVEEIWPVAVLGLLWLRIEVFGHRHADPEQADGSPGARMPSFLAGALARGESHPPHATHPPQPTHPPHATHPPRQGRSGSPQPHHLPHPHLGPKAVDKVFKFEMGVVILIALVFFVIWAEQQRETVSRNSNYVVCNWIQGC